MSIQAVFFDMGGTIETYWYTHELRLQATSGLQKLLLAADLDIHLKDEQLYKLISAGLDRYHDWRVHSLEELSPSRVWSEYILAGYPVDFHRLEAIAEDLMLYIETHFYQRDMRPEMPVVLDAIRQMGLKIGLISNVNSLGQVPTNLEKYGLRHYFDPIVLSSQYGRRKPDPAIFHYAARLANVPTSECLYVGDRISRDIVGARKAGYRLAIRIRHPFGDGEEDAGANPDAEIDQMTELLDMLQVELKQSAGDPTSVNVRQRPIRALLFDAGDVLYHRPHRGRELTTFLNELDIHPGQDTQSAVKYTLAHQAYQGKISQDQYREAMLRMYGVTQPKHIERGKQILEEEDNNIYFFEGVQETLITLKRMGFFLGVVTDTASPLHVKLRWFERGGFGHVWEAIISSNELGIRKPDPEIYHAALQTLGVLPSQAVFVGHSASELAGARAVGLITVAFNYDEAAEADYYIERFADLLKLPFVAQIEVDQP